MSSACTLIIYIGYIGIASGMIGVLCTSLLFGGVFRDDGHMNFVSDGFAKYNVVSTVLYGGVTSHCILAFRVVGIIKYIQNDFQRTLNILLTFISTMLFLVAIRYDEIRDAAHITVSIISAFFSLTVLASIIVFNGDFRKLNPELYQFAYFTWRAAVGGVMGIVALSLVYVQNPSVLSIIALLEFVSIETLLIIDLTLLISIESTLFDICQQGFLDMDSPMRRSVFDLNSP